jgi:pimeloyl-ACP methyl ester carboxylesterase
MIPDFLTLPDGRLAYQQLRGHPGSPKLVFLSGYASDMTGSKAEFLVKRCAEADYSFLRLDYRGTGHSNGDFGEGTIGGWYGDVCQMLDRLTEGPQIVIGSSMGGWLALLLAVRRPEKVRALIGIAAGPDFTEDLLLPHVTLEQHAQLARDSMIYMDSRSPNPPIPVHRRLLEEARQHLLLRGPIPVTSPVRLLQGMKDEEIPWQHAMRIVEAIPQGDVRLTLIKDGEHRLSRPEDLDLLWRTVGEFA